MIACFADTFYFLAMLNANDAAHARVNQFNSTLQRPIVTTAWVLTEVADALASTPNRALFRTLLNRLESDPRATIVPTSAELFADAVDLYDKRADKAWSLTDCVSFVVMRRQGLTDALTGDHHFEQAGFSALLK